MNVSSLRSKLGSLVDKAGGMDSLHLVPQLGGLRRELKDLEEDGHLGGAGAGKGGSKRRKRREEEEAEAPDVDPFGAGDDNDEGER